jgi:hypothetical protein
LKNIKEIKSQWVNKRLYNFSIFISLN